MRSVRPRLRYKQRVRAALRDALLRATGVTLLRDGCPEVRVEQIAEACGIAKGTAYLQFASRSDLLGSAVQRLDAELAARLADPPSNIGGAKAALRWTVMEAIDAQIKALGTPLPDNPARVNGACLWPCCHRVMPCPYGGPARSRSSASRARSRGDRRRRRRKTSRTSSCTRRSGGSFARRDAPTRRRTAASSAASSTTCSRKHYRLT